MDKQTGETPGEYNTLDPLTFEADHHTDLWIARRVMGWPEIHEKDRYRFYLDRGGVIIGNRAEIFRYGTIPDAFRPSSKMEDAMEVAHKMKSKGWWYHISGDPQNKDVMVIFGRDKGESQDELHSTYAEFEPLAICRAAGLAVMSETHG